jgi:hypothetical protein
MAAVPAYATFATRLLDIAADEQDPVAAANALDKLCRLARYGLLPPGHLPRLAVIVRHYLSGADAKTLWSAAVEIAVATGDGDLRATVTALAAGEISPPFAEGADVALWVRNTAQSALLRTDDDTPRAANLG